jgi:hypothetical protein
VNKLHLLKWNLHRETPSIGRESTQNAHSFVEMGIIGIREELSRDSSFEEVSPFSLNTHTIKACVISVVVLGCKVNLLLFSVGFNE